MPRTANRKRIPKVRLARPAGRPIQLRYTDAETGREVRITTNTYDEALDQLGKLQAKLTLGIDPRPQSRVRHDGPSMTWGDFRDAYTRLKVATFRSENAMEAAEVRLDICENIINPRTLGDMTRPATLARLQAELLAGTGGQFGKDGKPLRLSRSAHTVVSYMTTLIAAMNWAHSMKWLPEAIEFSKLDADDPDKGRPITTEEFERMLDVTPKVVGKEKARAWRHLLRGLWESGLRLTEAINVSWDTDGGIVPEWPAGGMPVLHIPAKMQKSRKAQDVPTTPAFAALLQETPAADRAGWVFNPPPRRGSRRLTAEQVGRIISLIGRRANVAVNATGKAASAHDLRRSFGQRMADSGLPVRDLQAIMRHASITTTEAYYLRDRIQDQAQRIAKYLGTPVSAQQKTATEEIAVSACQDSVPEVGLEPTRP